MKITFVSAPPNFGGGIRVIGIYADGLAKLGHEVTVVTMPRPWKGYRATVRDWGLAALGKYHPPTKGSHFDRLTVPVKTLERNRPLTNGDVEDADAIIATWWETAEWIAPLASSKGKKFYFVQGHEIFPEQPQDRVRATYKLPMQKITISRWLLKTMAEVYGDPNVYLVENGVDRQQFTSTNRVKQPRPTLAYLYNDSWPKGCDVTLKAIEKIRRSVPELRVIVFGMHAPTKQVPIADGAEFIMNPPQDKIREVYGSADVWVCGSRSEGFHLPPLEAMACGTPVVSTRVGGSMDVITDGVNGYLVNVEDVDALAEQAVNVLTLSPERWLDLSKGARDTAAKYDWNECVKRFEAILSLCCSGNDARSTAC